jgi:hypothetical protein
VKTVDSSLQELRPSIFTKASNIIIQWISAHHLRILAVERFNLRAQLLPDKSMGIDTSIKNGSKNKLIKERGFKEVRLGQ